MRPAHLAAALGHCIDRRLPAFIHGEPGVGKSQIVKQLAQERGIQLIDERALLRDPTDYKGLPAVDMERRLTVWTRPEFLPTDGAGILFLDELTAAPPATQNALLGLALDREIGDYRLPDNWAIVAAGNALSHRAHVHRMSSALNNRFIHFEATVHAQDWTRWAAAAGIKPEVIAFIQWKPDLLHDFDADKSAFPTPRSWERVSQMFPMPRELRRDLICGAVGEGAGNEFCAFLEMADQLPDVASVLANPTGAPVPEHIGARHAIAGAVANAADASNLDAVVTYSDRLGDEFQAMTMLVATERDPGLMSNKTFQAWAIKKHHLLT